MRRKYKDGGIGLGLKILILVLTQLFTSCMILEKDYGFLNLIFPFVKEK